MSDQIKPITVDVIGAASYTGYSKAFLNKLRTIGGGPVFVKRGGAVRYLISDLDAWLQAGRRASTSAEVEAA